MLLYRKGVQFFRKYICIIVGGVNDENVLFFFPHSIIQVSQKRTLIFWTPYTYLFLIETNLSFYTKGAFIINF